MAIHARKIDTTIGYAAVAAYNTTRRATRPMGRATLVGGTVTVTGQTLRGDEIISLTRNTSAGTAGDLSAPSGSRTSTQFVIQSASGTDTSTVEWTIDTPVVHFDATSTPVFSDGRTPSSTTLQVTAVTATNLATSVALANDCKHVYTAHYADDVAHVIADTANLVAAADATDLATGITLANEVKADFNLHRVQAGIHLAGDAVNVVVAANATDQTSLNTLTNALKAALNLHVSMAAQGSSVKLLEP